MGLAFVFFASGMGRVWYGSYMEHWSMISKGGSVFLVLQYLVFLFPLLLAY